MLANFVELKFTVFVCHWEMNGEIDVFASAG